MSKNQTPMTGGGDQNKMPRKGGVSAPTERPSVHGGIKPRNPRSSMSAPTDRPAVRSGVSIPSTGGDGKAPQVLPNAQVDRIAPKRGNK